MRKRHGAKRFSTPNNTLLRSDECLISPPIGPPVRSIAFSEAQLFTATLALDVSYAYIYYYERRHADDELCTVTQIVLLLFIRRLTRIPSTRALLAPSPFPSTHIAQAQIPKHTVSISLYSSRASTLCALILHCLHSRFAKSITLKTQVTN